MSSSKKAPKAPKMPDPKELIALQAEMNRVNIDTPFGKQTYVPGPDGSTTLKTDIGPLGEALVGRGVGLGMTDSARQTIDPRMNELAGALLGRVGQRFGMDLGGALQLAPNPAMPQSPSKPGPSASPMPDPMGGGMTGGMGQGGGGGGMSILPWKPDEKMQIEELMRSTRR